MRCDQNIGFLSGSSGGTYSSHGPLEG
jgi:hypothetical protein